jgi:hypothetical protein
MEFSPSGRFFAIGEDGRFVCDATSFTCRYAGEGTVSWFDDDQYVVLRSDGHLALVEGATGAAEDIATNATAVAIRPR